LLVDVIQRRVYWQNEEGRGAERGGGRSAAERAAAWGRARQREAEAERPSQMSG
jgi:hypothetical protein